MRIQFVQDIIDKIRGKKTNTIKCSNKEKYIENISIPCLICKEKSYKYTEANILNKYKVNYFYCPNCGHIQTEKPYWLKEAYSNAIADTDVGILERNKLVVKNLSKIICNYFNINATFLEYAGGYGILTRTMRDLGFDFLWQDKYSENIFAKGFEYKGHEKIELLTAVEVFEHFENPLKEIENLFKISDNIFFTQTTIPDNIPQANDWWYFACETGQHISFYTNKTLDLIAEKFSKKHLYYNEIHLFTNKNISLSSFKKIIKNKKDAKIPLKSKTWEDYLLIKDKK